MRLLSKHRRVLALSAVAVLTATLMGVRAGPASAYAPFDVAFVCGVGSGFNNQVCETTPGQSGVIPSGVDIATGTSPAMAPVGGISGDDAVAFQGANGHLWTWDVFGGSVKDTGLGMASGTSPAIEEEKDGTLRVAFQSSGGTLWIYWPTGGSGRNTSLGMAGGASPDIDSSINGPVVAFQADNGNLYTYHVLDNTHQNTGLGMSYQTRPSISGAFNTGDPDAVAFVTNTGFLWIYYSDGRANTKTGYGVAPGTSPNWAGAGAIAFQGSGNNHLYIRQNTGGLTDTVLGMAPGTSPSTDGGGEDVAFQANTGILWDADLSDGINYNTHIPMSDGTSPSALGSI